MAVRNDCSETLSRSQIGIWIAQQLDPTNPVYNVGEYLEIMV
jgi:glyine---[glycyl-carrier protein] ligase